MAQQGVALGGAAAGALLGSFIPGIGWVLGAQIGFALGSAAGGLLFPSKGPKAEKGDLTVQAASYGTPISILSGTDRTAGTMIWVQGNELIRKKVKQGGKGFMGGGGVTTYEYFASFAVLIGEGPIDGVRRIWCDTKLEHDKSGARLDDVLANGGQFVTSLHAIDSNLRIYLGTEDQLPDPLIQADVGADNASAHRGLAYIVFEELPLKDFANRIPNISVEYVKDGAMVYRDLAYDAGPASIGVFNNVSFDPFNGPYLWGAVFGTDWIAKWNTSTGGLDLAVQVGQGLSGTAPVVDELGNVYVAAFTGAAFYRYDAVTLSLTGTASFSGGGSPPNSMTYRSFESGSTRRIVGANTGSGHICLYDASSLEQLAAALSASVGPVVDIDIDGNLYGVSGTSVKKFAVTETPTGSFPHAISLANTWDLNATHGGNLSHIHYYTDESVLLVFGNDILSKVDPDTGAVLASLDVGGSYGSGGDPEWRRGPVNGRMWFRGASDAYVEVDLATMTILRSLAQSLWVTQTTSLRGYDPWSDSLFVFTTGGGANLTQNFLPRLDPLDVDRADVITQYSELAGLTTSQINVTLVTDTIQGYTTRRQTTARDGLEPIAQSGFLDAAEVDGKVKWVPRGQSVTLTVPEDDLGAALWGDGGEVEKLVQTMPQELNLPERVLIRAPNRDNQYDYSAQAAKRSREIIRSREQMTFDTAEVMSDDTAMRLAERLLYSLWAEKPVQFSLPPKYRKLIPTDVINILVGSLSFRVRITKIDDGPYLQCEGVTEESATYVSTATGGAGNIPGQVLQLLSPTQLFLIDSNLIRDEDDDGGHYLGIAPTVPDGLWDGAQIFKSSDAVTFQASTSFDTAVDWGAAEGALADHHCTTTDRYNTLTIRLVRDEAGLASCTEEEMNTGANAFLLQSGDDLELIQAADITDLGGGRYTLATLLRGRRGTEQAAGGHAAGDKIIVLSAATMQRILSDSEIGQERYYKPVTFGTLFNPTGAIPFTNTARGRECYAPEHVKGSRDGSNNLTITWSRRSRIGDETDWADNVAAPPLAEDSEAYEVDILDGSDVVRTITASSETAAYSAANQTTDFGSPQVALDVVIYQMSAVNGRGRPASATI